VKVDETSEIKERRAQEVVHNISRLILGTVD